MKKIQVEINTDDSILAQNIATKIAAFAEKFATPEDFQRFLSAAPNFVGNFIVKQALADSNIKLKV